MGVVAVLECVVALGHGGDEDGGLGSGGRRAGLVDAFLRRGYTTGAAAAAALLAPLGRPAPEDGCSTYLSRVAPPVVVRIVANESGRHGAEAARALLDGMRHADAAVYLGHLRFGLGPDFEPAAPIRVAAGVRLPADTYQFAAAARAAARGRGVGLEEVLDGWLDAGTIYIERSNDARVVLSHRNLVPSSVLGRLTHWVARRAAGGLPEPAFAGWRDGAPARRRLWVLMTCRAAALFPELRRGGLPSSIDLMGPRGLVSLREWPRLAWIVDALRAGGDRSEIRSAVAGSAYPDVVVDAGERDRVRL
jgi:hypothetical protein